MKKLFTLGACGFAAAGMIMTASGQIQTAGVLQVDVDATSQPVGALTYLTNNGAAGGVFLASANGVAGITPQVIALGGNGTHGALLDGNQIFLAHYTAASGGVVQLPPAGLVGANPDFSVEAWVYKATINTETGPVSWGTRATGQEVSCGWGRNTTWGGLSFYAYDYSWAVVPSPGAWHHLVWIYNNTAVDTNAGTVLQYRDGVLDKSALRSVAPNVAAGYNILIGGQHAGAAGPAGGTFTAGVVGKVRIHDGVLTAAQVLNNYNYEVASFTNGTPATLLTTGPLHRYSFNLPPTNNAIGAVIQDTGIAANAPGVVKGTTLAAAAIPYFDGANLVLQNYGGGNSGATNGYVDFPNGLLSSLSASNGGPGAISFELWVEPTANRTWSELLYFGNSSLGEITTNGIGFTGQNGIVIPSQVNTSVEQSGVRGAVRDIVMAAYLMSTRKHIVVTWDEPNNLIKLYHEGVLVEQFRTAIKMNAIIDVNNWLGRSGWGGDAVAAANYREFRIYNRVLSESEIRRNYIVGPYDAMDASSLAWNGNVNGNWDITTLNWLAGGISTNYTDSSVVQLDDTATGTTSINLATAVSPKSVTVINTTKPYTLSGAGKISGATGLTKSGNGILTIATTNDYTGPTVLVAGTVAVNNLANGGLPSAVGSSSADPTSLVLSGGKLSYQGPAATINRGYQVLATNSTIEVQNDLSLSGLVIAGGGGAFVKSGPATLTYLTPGTNALSAGGLPGYNVTRGAVVFDGSVGGQTNRNIGELWLGSASYGANLVVSNATLLSSSWIAVGRGNGSVGNVSTATLNNGNITVSANGMSLGYDGGLAGNRASQLVTLNGSSVLNITSAGNNMNIGESMGSFGTLRINGTSWARFATPRLGVGLNATGAVYIADSGRFTNATFMSIGTGAGTNGTGSGGVGLMVVKDNGVLSSTGDFNVTDLANSVGELDISNTATAYVNGAVFIGKAAGTTATVNQSGGSFLHTGGGNGLIGGNVAAAATSVGTWNLSGGLASLSGNFQVGTWGQGTWNQSGGTSTFASWFSIGRYNTGVGVVNVSGGMLAHTSTTTDIIVGEEGNGTLNISGTGAVITTNQVRLGNLAGAVGTVTLSGGSLVTKRIYTANASASSLFNFDGGLLRAADGATADFLSGLSYVSVLAGGARVDVGTNNLTIAQDLSTDGLGGGFTKLGTGSLMLPGYLSYNGPTLVSSGLLGITTHCLGGGSLTVADGATLALQVLDYAGAYMSAASLTLGNTTGATLTFNLGYLGNPTAAPLALGTGALTMNGTCTINIDPNSSLSVGPDFPLIQYGTLAGSGHLVLGTLPPGVTAALVTNTVNSTIDLQVIAVFQPRWEGQAGGDWDVQITTNWLDIITGLPQYFYQGTRAVFNDDATGTTNVNLVTVVTPGGVLVSNSILNYAMSGTGRIAGGGSLVKVGTGSLTLSTTNNSYSGATVIDGGGTVVSTVANNLGTNSALSIGSGTLSLGAGNQKFSTVALTNGVIEAAGATITAAAYNLDNGTVSALLAGGTLATFGANTDVITVSGGNTYTGRTYLAGSTLSVTNLANGGAPSGIGTSSAGPTNLVFAGGGLSYSGSAVAIDRGYTVENGGRLSASGNVTLGGPITAAAGNFAKSGAAAVTYAALGTNVLSRGGYYIGGGSVVLNGGASTPTNYLQTNIVVGEVWVGYDQANAGALTLTNSSLSISSWLAIDRGNGVLGSQSVASFYDSLITVANCSMGYANGIADNWSRPVLSLYGNSRLTNTGILYVGESAGSDAKVIISGSSAVTAGSTFIGHQGNANGVVYINGSGSLTSGKTFIGQQNIATGAVYIADSGSLNVNASWFSLGAAIGNDNVAASTGGNGSLVLSNNARVNVTVDYNLADISDSTALLEVHDNATNLAPTLYVAKGTNCIAVVNQSGGYVGRSVAGGDWRLANHATATGTYNLSGGVFEPVSNFQIGAYGSGTFNLSGGVANCASYPVVGRYVGSVGALNVSGGTFNQTVAGNLLIIGEEGTGTLTISGSGLVNSVNGLSLGHTVTGVGVVNLNGGTLRTTRVYQAGGAGALSTFNFAGGVLQASANNATFMTGLGQANVLAGGAVIDSSTNSITIVQALLGSGADGGLTKLGAGTLALSGANNYVGATIVSNGTLRINGSTTSANVDVKAGAALGGTGTIGGDALVETGGALSPGASVGTLTVNGNLTLGGNLFIELDKTLVQSNDLTIVGGTLANTGSGVVTVTNIGTVPVALGDTFQLFSRPLVNGSALTITPNPGSGLTWTNRLAVDGTISAVTGIAMNPTNISYSVSGNTLTLTWPSDHLGWILQSQTNTLDIGIAHNWYDVAGSGSSTQAVIHISPLDPAVFFRLRSP